MTPRQLSKLSLKLPLSLLLSCALSIPALVVGGETDSKTKPETKTGAKHQSSGAYPKPGMSMKQVRKRYGEPKSVRKSKGRVKKLWPRITVWNYGTHSVYFERHLVLHTVVH